MWTLKTEETCSWLCMSVQFKVGGGGVVYSFLRKLVRRQRTAVMSFCVHFQSKDVGYWGMHAEVRESVFLAQRAGRRRETAGWPQQNTTHTHGPTGPAPHLPMHPRSCIQIYRRPLKAPPANPRTYTISVLKCNCWYYNAIVGTIFKNRDLQHGGIKNKIDSNIGPRFVW